MNIFKKILLGLLVLFVASSLAGYVYFEKKFTPAENYLEVKGISEQVPLKWVSTTTNPNAALLLPVKIKGINTTFYMQLDFGSPSTLFYSKSLSAIQSKFPEHIMIKKGSDKVSLQFNLGNMSVSSPEFKTINYGKEPVWTPNETNIIGTLGTDLLEKRKITLNFKDHYCSFKNSGSIKNFKDFDFKKRKILFPATINGKKLKLLYDSGTSGYELVTSKKQWDFYKLGSKEIKVEEGNSWGNKLTVFSAPANENIEIGNAILNLNEVTYIEGTSTLQRLLMKFSGMHGMIGNKLFLNHRLIIDCKNEKFKIAKI